MSKCSCDEPTELRATSENAGSSYLYLRCSRCGGKAGRVSIDERDLRENIPNPDEIKSPVSIRFDPGDNIFTQLDGEKSYDDGVSRLYGKRRVDNTDYWVYVLDCRPRFYYDDYDDLKRRAKKRVGHEPDWLRMAWEARKRRYVGQTEDLFKRLGEHFEQNRTTDFTELFEPNEIAFLKPCYNRRMAEREEERIGKTHYDREDTYAYWK